MIQPGLSRAAGVLFLAFSSTAASASQVVLAYSQRGRSVVVANGPARTLEAVEVVSRQILWKTGGPAEPHLLVTDQQGEHGAVIDAIGNTVRLFNALTGKYLGVATRVPETPVAALWHEGSLFVLSRDEPRLTRLEVTGGRREVRVDAGSSLLRRNADTLVVYSPESGSLSLYDSRTLERVRTSRVPPHGSDLELDSRFAYVTHPATAKISIVSLESLKIEEELSVGSVPLDTVVERRAGTLAASALLVADPSAKRVWKIEGRQSTGEAFGRGMLRGFLGLGLFVPKSKELPTGIDRVWTSGALRFGLDSSAGRLYDLSGSSITLIATNVKVAGITPTADGIAFWDNIEKSLKFWRRGEPVR